MRSIEPKAELPLVHVPLTNAMPARPPRGPTKNLTGIYLGSVCIEYCFMPPILPRYYNYVKLC